MAPLAFTLDRQDHFESDVIQVNVQMLNQIESDGVLILQTPEFSGSFNATKWLKSAYL